MTEIEVPGPEPDWQPATQPPYYTGKNPASQYSVWEHHVPLFQMIGVLALPVQPVAQRLRLQVERSWDGLDELDVVLFRGKDLWARFTNSHNWQGTWERRASNASMTPDFPGSPRRSSQATDYRHLNKLERTVVTPLRWICRLRNTCGDPGGPWTGEKAD